MSKTANKVVEQAQAWLGYNEKDGTFKTIIDVYNAYKPLARGYKVKYSDQWCATFVSAVAIKLGYTDIIPTECSCQKMIDLFKKLGCWVENENRTPNASDIIFYDWQDDGKDDASGWADHVGIVEKVLNGKITVIEGNYSKSVKRRTIAVNGKYIRGYGVPKYTAEEPEAPKRSATVLEWQKAAIADGFKFPKYGADGKWGAECEKVAKEAICKKRLTYKYKNLTKIIQKAVGVKADGKFGNDTKKAVVEWQERCGLVDDGCVGLNTWKRILGV